MRKASLCLCTLMIVLPALAGEPLPADVQRFVERREGCDHMRGEMPDPGEKRRIREMRREVEKLCKGTDKELAQLKKKYAMNLSVARQLHAFESGIEPADERVSRSRAGGFCTSNKTR